MCPCNGYRQISLTDRNVPCPACRPAAYRIASEPLVHECPECHAVESIAPGVICGPFKGREFARNLTALSVPLEVIVADRVANGDYNLWELYT